MLLTLLVLVPLLTGLLCWPVHQRTWLERLNLLAFVVLATLAIWVASVRLPRMDVAARKRSFRCGKA